ncbi:MAG TPA: AAA family ATPase, partial [Fimbriimonas sp.]|nr:AAA family ATPase [Fimbriimonas sp.]
MSRIIITVLAVTTCVSIVEICLLMPGTRLSNDEKELEKKWKQPASFPSPLLRGISIEGDPGLRGIKKLDLNFCFPVVAIAGKNGTGKSTLLALAALAFHAPAGHFSRGAKAGVARGHAYYTFRDFIFRGVSDPDITGLKITWRYEDGTSVSTTSITKRTEKWMHYERRPIRAVHYLGIGRCVPAIEQNVLRTHFGHGRAGLVTQAVSAAALAAASEVLGKTYDAAETLTSKAYRMRKCNAGEAYSGFNMGAGEDVVIEMLGLIDTAPAGSLIVIEEVELGLHPEAVRRLARALIKLARTKQLQIVVSTHSEAFLDELPRAARVLFQRVGDEFEVTESPTTRFCFGALSGVLKPELFVYCEDNVAVSILDELLPIDVRKRVLLIAVGSDSELASARYVHEKQHLTAKALILWDGDVTDAKIGPWLKQRLVDRGVPLGGVSYWRLPLNVTPEKSVLNVLNTVDGKTALSVALNCD